MTLTVQDWLTTTRAISYAPEYDSTIATDVSWVTDNVALCNRQVASDTTDSWLNPPQDDTQQGWSAFSDVALLWFLYLWNQKIGNKIKSDSSKASYDIQLAALKLLGASDVSTNRRPAVIAGQDPRDNKIILPTQASIFAFDDWA